MVSSAKAAVPTVSDQAAAMQLSQCAKNLATSLAELRTASQKASEPLSQHLAHWEQSFRSLTTGYDLGWVLPRT